MYINGEVVSHTLLEFSAAIPGKGTRKYLGITEANYNDELKQTLEYGAGALPLGVSVQQYAPAADVGLLKNEGQRFLDDAGDGYGLILISFIFAYRPLTPGAKLHVDRVPGAKVTKVEDATAKGGEGNIMKLTLLVTDVISRNGKRIIIPTSNKIAIR